MFREPKEVLDYIYNLLNDNKGALGLEYVAYGDETLLPRYPAAVVTVEPVTREIHATRQFRLYFNVSIWVLHAKLSQSHRIRTREDLDLATGVRNKLHADFTLQGNVVFGYVTSEVPGIIQRTKGEAIVSTRLTWNGTSIVPFV